MRKLALAALLALAGTSNASNNAVGSRGYTNLTTKGFILELDTANQVATRLIALPGSNAGSSAFNFLLPANGRTDDGYYYLGDLQLRMRALNTAVWTDLSSQSARQAVKISPGQGNVLTSADFTSSLGSKLPITVVRTWSKDGDSVVMTFNITNVGGTTLEFGGVGIPLPYNNNWVNKDQNSTWTENVVSDPAVSLDAGYVITNRLTGQAPTLITAPVEKTPLEQYRLNYQSEPDYPQVWLDKTPIDFNYEGVFSWWMATSGLGDLDDAAARDLGFVRGSDFNVPSNFTIAAKKSRVIGVRLFTASGPRAVEDRLPVYGRPTVVGIPGFVVNSNDQVTMIVRSTSSPAVAGVSPTNIEFQSATSISTNVYAITGKVKPGAFGQTRVSIAFANGDIATAHYNVVNPAPKQLDNLGSFRFQYQWFNNKTDYFGRAPGILTYDHQKGKQVVDDPRAWVAGMSDEAGTGAYVSAAAKQLGRPDKKQVAMLEQFAGQTIFGKLQVSSPGPTYGGVKKSLFYYDASLASMGIYDPTIDHSGTWDKGEADLLSRSYNYPHPLVVYWTLYRLARNYNGLTTIPWTWYIDRCYDTIAGMQTNAGIDNGYAQFGLMEGTYFQMVLLDLTWNSETYPYASEFPWDNTGQEEVYAWTRYFGYSDKAKATVETLMAIMPSVPHWGYSGSGRDLWDFLYSGQYGNGARIERIFHHYKGAQSALPLVTEFQSSPADIKMLRAGYGGVLGPLTSIGSDGFGSTGFHTRPDYLGWDPLSGDNGVNIVLHALSTRAVAVNDATLGGWAGFGAQISQSGNVITIKPTDSFRQRLFIADNALYLELDAGHFNTVTYDTSSRKVVVTFDMNDGYTPNGRIRWSTTASTVRSGTYKISGSYKVERGCSVVPLNTSATTTVTLTQ